MENDRDGVSGHSSCKIPLWVKPVYTSWVVLLLTTYRHTTLLGLLWSCNVALLVAWDGFWFESSLLVSMAALGIVWWQLLWVIDFLIHAITGWNALGMSNYMFDAKFSLFSRGMSLYHGWLPFTLLWGLSRLGYNRRALIPQTLVAWTVFVLSALLTTDVTGPAGSLNMVYGLSETAPQTWMRPSLWFTLVMVLWSASVYLPSHIVFTRVFGTGAQPNQRLQPAAAVRS